MSVTFYAETERGHGSKREPCLCSQMSPAFADLFEGRRDDWGALRADANPACLTCEGSGVEEVRVDLRPQVNLSNDNAKIVMGAMGWKTDPRNMCGECDLATLRRGIVRARNTDGPDVLRERVETSRYIAYGYTRADLLDALARLEDIAQRGQAAGATKVTWG